MAEQVTDTRKETRRNPGRITRVLRYAGATAAAATVVVGSWYMFRNNNMDDFMDLHDFTSPEHQDDRCNAQKAQDIQGDIKAHFDKNGGMTDEEAELYAPIVGVPAEDVKTLTSIDLYPMDYDCEVATASSQEATIGLAMVTLGAGAALGGVVVHLTSGRRE